MADYSGWEIRKLYADGERDFQNIDLSGANLQGANLQGANLQGAVCNEQTQFPRNFDKTKARVYLIDPRTSLLQANILGKNIEGADLEGANIQKANLQKANLSRANLQGANLQEANLKQAKLVAANRQKAKLIYSVSQISVLRRNSVGRARGHRPYENGFMGHSTSI